jgi:molybdopterin converting factor small subunit
MAYLGRNFKSESNGVCTPDKDRSELTAEDRGGDSAVPATCPGRNRQTPGDGDAHVLRDIALGATCGLAALGIAAGAWIGALRGQGNAEGALAAPGGTSLRSGEGANGKTITINVTTFGSLRSVIGGAATRVTMPEGATVSALSWHLADLYPELAPAAMLAVNDASEMLPLNEVLIDGQSVELIGSMAGG